MMRENKLKEKLRRGQPVLGILSAVAASSIAEMIGLAGFDFYMLDGEHGPVTPAQAAGVVRACESVKMTPLVRVGQKEPKLVLQYLDAGMMGIMMPGLESAGDVEMLVSAAKYPPLGKRGLGIVRAADYWMGTVSIADYITLANQQTLLLPQFEDVALLERLPEMVAVKGIDGIVIGPLDLSLSMGYREGPSHPEVQAVIDQAIHIIREAGLWVGITANSGQAARAQIERGAQLILITLSQLLKSGSGEFLAEARQH
jgi:4-hydroxy-2-oxoheptanedioate aldolase